MKRYEAPFTIVYIITKKRYWTVLSKENNITLNYDCWKANTYYFQWQSNYTFYSLHSHGSV